MTVRQATLQAFNEMPDEFHILMLCRKVKGLLHRPNLMDGSITRRLRELREDGTIRYKITNGYRAIYTKNDQLNLFRKP